MKPIFYRLVLMLFAFSPLFASLSDQPALIRVQASDATSSTTSGFQLRARMYFLEAGELKDLSVDASGVTLPSTSLPGDRTVAAEEEVAFDLDLYQPPSASMTFFFIAIELG